MKKLFIFLLKIKVYYTPLNNSGGFKQYGDFINYVNIKVSTFFTAFLDLLINKILLLFFYKVFSHISKCLKICQLNITKITEKGYKKKLVKDIKVFLRRMKNKSNNMVVDDTKIYQKMKNKSWLSIEKNTVK